MGTAPGVQDVVQWSFELNELITLHFSKVFEHACAEGVTDLSTLCFCSQCAMRKQAFYRRALLRWIKRRTESLNLRPLKFSLKIVLNDHRAWPCSVSHPIYFAKQPCRQYTSSDIPFAHSMHLAFSRCLNMSKCAKPGCGYLCGFFSDLPLPHKTSSLKHRFPFMCPGTQSLWRVVTGEWVRAESSNFTGGVWSWVIQSEPPLTWSSALLRELMEHFRSLLCTG